MDKMHLMDDRIDVFPATPWLWEKLGLWLFSSKTHTEENYSSIISSSFFTSASYPKKKKALYWVIWGDVKLVDVIIDESKKSFWRQLIDVSPDVLVDVKIYPDAKIPIDVFKWNQPYLRKSVKVCQHPLAYDIMSLLHFCTERRNGT